MIPPFKKPGDPIKADEWNELIKQLVDSGVVQFGQRVGGAHSTRQVPAGTPAPIGITCEEEIPPYSLFVPDDDGSAQPMIMAVRAYDGSSESFPPLLFTNGGDTCPAGGHATAWPVRGYTPYRIAITGDTPAVGDECGPDLDDWGVDANSGGLICVALEAETHAWVYDMPRLGMVLARLTEDISPGGSAMVDLQVWNGSAWTNSGQVHEAFDSIGDKSGRENDKCWCEWSSDSHRLEMIQLYCLQS